jgi:hypothetical protein
MRIHLAIGAWLLAVSMAVQAEDAGSGFYVDLAAGHSDFGHGGGSAVRLSIGYQFDPRIAAELSFADLGGTRPTAGRRTTILGAQTTDLSGVLSWPLAERLFLQGRLGLFAALLQTQTDDGFDFDSTYVSASGVVVGLGWRYQLTDRVAARLEWQRYNDVGGIDVEVVSLGAVLRF